MELSLAVVGTGFSYNAVRRTAQAQVVSQLIGRIADIRRLGAASLDLCSVADSELDAYFEVGLSPWDYAAGVLIATEAGCQASGLEDRPCSGEMTAVCGPASAQEFFHLLQDLRAASV